MCTSASPTHAEQTGDLVRGFMAQAGVTVLAAADLLGLPQSSMSARLNGRTRFTAEEIATLAAWLDLEACLLIAPAVALWPAEATA